MTPLEQWLSDATPGLSAESAALVREEIEQHYESACQAGDDAIAILGSPRAANRAYRKVLLTEQEAMLAPAFAQPKKQSASSIFVTFAFIAAFVWLSSRRHHDPEFWAIMATIFVTIPLGWFFRPTTLSRCRIYTWVYVGRAVLVAAIACWYDPDDGWMYGPLMGGLIFSLDYFLHYKRLSIFRKLAAGQTWSLLPEEPQLTHVEAICLNRLRKNEEPIEKVLAVVIVMMFAAMAVWLPATFAPAAVFVAVDNVIRRLPVGTVERSRLYRIVRWTAMAAAAVLPFLWRARGPWAGAAQLALIFLLVDRLPISIRRKLSVSEWPERLYW
jgi:hypothetical protein